MLIWQKKEWWDMLIKSKQAEKILNVWWLQIEKRSIWFWFFGLFIIWIEQDYFFDNIYDVEKELITFCKKEKCLFIQIETVNYFEKEKFFLESTKFFKLNYYKKFIMPFTALINLEKSDEEILTLMKQKWRYNIKLAEKKWVVVKKVEKTDENIEKFHELMKETTKRNWFNWNSFDFYKILLNSIKTSELFFAYKDENVISALILIYDEKVAFYYYWASTSDINYRNLMSPYLLQWEAIKYSKEKWCKVYDFLWVANPDENNSSLAWVTEFKTKLTNEIKKVSKSYIYIDKKCIFLSISLLKKIKSFIKR